MALPTPLLKQGLVRDIVRERMRESVLAIGNELGLIEKLSRLQAGEGLEELSVGELCGGLKERQGDVRADHRGGLEQTLCGGRQTVDAGRQDGLYRGGDVEGVEAPREMITASLAHEGTRLRQCPHGFLEKEGIPLSSFGQHSLQRCQRLVVSQELVEQFLGALREQRMNSELSVVSLARPAVLVFGTVGDEEEKAGSGKTHHEAVQERLRRRVDPLEILEQEEQRTSRALSKHEAPHAFEGTLTALLRVE